MSQHIGPVDLGELRPVPCDLRQFLRETTGDVYQVPSLGLPRGHVAVQFLEVAYSARMASPDEWLTAPEAAAELGVAYMTLYRWIRAGKGPVEYRIGREIRVSRSDLNDFVEAHRIAPGDLDHLDLA